MAPQLRRGGTGGAAAFKALVVLFFAIFFFAFLTVFAMTVLHPKMWKGTTGSS
jgi:hypothetical protein